MLTNMASKAESLQNIIDQTLDSGYFPKIFIGLFVLVITVAYLKRDRSKEIPRVGGIPFFGSLRTLSKRPPHKMLSHLKKKHGDIFWINLGSKETLVCCSLEGMTEALLCRGAVYCDRPDTFTASLLYGGDRSNGLVMADYDDKFRMKKRLLESCMVDRGDIMPDAEDKIVQMVVKICYEFEEHAGSSFNPRDVIACGVMNMITLIVFDEEFAYNDTEFIKLLYTMDIRFKCGYSQIGDFLPLLKFLPSEKARLLHLTHNMLRAFTYQQINQHKEDYEPTEFKDVVHRFLRHLELNEDFGALKDMDLICMLIDIMSQSFEPVTATLEWTLLYMAAFPEVQIKVQKELDTVIGRERLPQLDDRANLPYTRATIYEIQRMSTVMPLMFPHCTIAGTKLLGFDIPQFSNVLFNLWSIHHDGRYWKKPYTFNPERFLDPAGNLVIPEAFLPYGMGRRCCLGKVLADAQVFLFFSIMMHQMFIKPTPGKEVNLEGDYMNFVLQPKILEILVEDNSKARDKKAASKS